MAKLSLRDEILATGALKFGEFTAHNGELGNQKIVLNALLSDDRYEDLRKLVTNNLASRIKAF